ncbi:gmc oxidoreductase protein [Apiospora arundinis]
MNGLEVSPFIAALPKVELHVHIEGTLTPALRWKLAKRNNVPLPYATYDDLLESYNVLYNHRKEVHGDNGAPHLSGDLLRRDPSPVARDMNVRYAEPFFDLQAYLPRGIPAAAVLNGYMRAQREGAAKFGVRSNWILCFIRDRPVAEGVAAYEVARAWAQIPGGHGLFHAVGLASNEYDRPPMLFERAFQMAKQDGLHVTMHCDVDQKDAADHIHEAIFDVLGGQGTERIDHGLNALDRPELLQGLASRGIPLTLCPHAYHRRQATDVLFPKLRKLWELEGIKWCINSDDPTYMHNVWIDGAMEKVYHYCGIPKADMVRLSRDAVEISWADEELKIKLLQELESSFGYPGTNASYDYVGKNKQPLSKVTASTIILNHLKSPPSPSSKPGGFYEVENANRSVVPLLALTGLAFLDPSPETFASQPLMDWGLVSKPIPAAGGRRGALCARQDAGRVVRHQHHVVSAGTKSSYQWLADLVGDQDWTFDNLLKYFKKSCRLIPPNLEKRNNTNVTVTYDPTVFDPNGGPLHVSWNNWVDPTLTVMSKAVEEAGLSPSSKGFSNGELVGHGAWIPSTINPGNAHRSSSESSFLRNAIQGGGTLVVYTHTQARRIRFERSSPPRAIGVEVETWGLQYSLNAAKEVIISAGTFHSPQLLMVSGIGPKAVLDSQSIPVIVDSPGVGQNLVDPVQIAVSHAVNTPSGQSLTADPAPSAARPAIWRLSVFPPRLRSALSAGALEKLAGYPADWPEIMYIVGSFLGHNLATIGATAAWMPITFSRGNITLRSASMAEPPSISLNWLDNSVDAEIALAAFKRLREIWMTEAASAIQDDDGPELLPGAGVQTDQQVLDYIRQSATPIWHPAGTCAMGRSGEDGAVVDSKARVFGVEGLSSRLRRQRPTFHNSCSSTRKSVRPGGKDSG